MKEIKIETPLTNEVIKQLKIGDNVLLNGYIFTARDLAHERLIKLIRDNKPLPFDIKGNVIFYVGPSPAKPGYVIGSAGPTTSYRMDPYTPVLLKKGLKGMIGKGNRSQKVIDSIKQNICVYFGAVGGAAALLSKCIIESKIIAFEELGAEAIRKLKIKDMPLTVINDCLGNNLYIEGKNKYKIK